MKEIALNVKKRQTGKSSSKSMRREGFVPGIYYMDGKAGIPILSDTKALRPIVYTASKKVINLSVDGDPNTYNCVLKEVKFHPVTDKILHFDLLGLNPDRKLSVQVPVVVKGLSIGVRKGGKMQQSLHKVKIKCLPKDLIDAIEVEVSNLEMGQSVYLKDVTSENIEFEVPSDTIIVSVFAPRGASQSELEGTAGAGDIAAAAPAVAKK